MMSLITMEISPKMLKIGNKLARVAAILDLKKVNFDHIQPCMTFELHAKNENVLMNNNGDIAQYCENCQKIGPHGGHFEFFKNVK